MPDQSEKEFEEAYKEAYHYWQPAIDQMNIDVRFYLNDQWTDADISYFKQQGRSPLVFNRLKKVADLVSGYEQRNKLVLKIGPIGGEDDPACDQFNKLMPVIMNYNGYELLSEGFLMGPCVSGSNLIEFWPDDDNDLQFHRWSHNSFLLDPTLTKKDLSDCAYIILAKMVTKGEAKKLLPLVSGREIDNIEGKAGQDIVFPDLPAKDIKQGKRRYQLCYFYERDNRNAKFLINRQTGQKIEWRNTAEALKEFMLQYGNFFAVVTRPKKSVKLTIYLDGVQLSNTYFDPYKLGDYNFIWLPGTYIYEEKRADLKLQSLIRVARDAQITDNRRLMSMVDILESQAYGGDYYEEGALKDDEDAYLSGAGHPVFFQEGKLKEGFLPRQHKEIPQSMFQLHQIVHQMLIDLPGLNEEIIGSEEKEIPGILSKLRSGAALTILQNSFANFRFAKKCMGRKIVRMIQNNWPDQKITRITGQPLAQGFRDPDFTKYDCTPQEGLLTATQREMAYAELKSLKDQGWPIPYSAIVEVYPGAMKSHLKKHLKAAEQEQAKLQQIQMNQQQIMQALQKAKLMEDMAATKEKHTQSVENMANAQFDRIKSAKEIQKFDQDFIFGILDRLKGLADAETQAASKQVTRR